jgi:hypothetical protein
MLHEIFLQFAYTTSNFLNRVIHVSILAHLQKPRGGRTTEFIRLEQRSEVRTTLRRVGCNDLL